MASPTKITYDYSFLDHTVNDPDVPQPGDKLDEAYAEVKRASDETIDRLNLIQRDDGDLANQSVGFDQLRPELAVGFKPPEPWEPNHAYVVRDTVFANNSFYTCLVAHTSGTDFEVDLASGRWSLVADFTEATTDAQAARDKAKQWAENPVDVPVEPGLFSAKHHATKAANSATASANSATASANSATASANSATASANSATASNGSATASANSAAASLASKNAAAISETNAANSATASANSASAALASKNAAAVSETNALTSENAAEDAADRAEAAAVSVENPVSFKPQALTSAQQGQARANIGAGVLAGFRNKIINGGFAITQRGNSQTTSGYGSVDRWNVQHSGTGHTKTATRGSFTLDGAHVGKPARASNYLSVSFVSSSDPSGYHVVAQRLEGLRNFAGGKFTLTYWQRGTAGLSLATSIYQIFGTGGAPSPIVSAIGVNKVPVSGSGWQKISYVIDVPSIEGKTLGTNGDDCLQVSFFLSAGSVLAAESGNLGPQSGDIEIANVSLVEGDATAEDDPFSPRHIEQELALCQRYYAKTFSWGTTPTNGAGFGGAISASTLSIGEVVATWQFPQLMRTPPSMTFFNPGSGASGMWRNFADTASAAVNTFGPSSNRGCILVATSGPTTQHIAIHATADAEL